MKNILKKLWILIFSWILAIVLINIYVLSFSYWNIHTDTTKLQAKPVGIVFWARVFSNGQPSDILKDRLSVAISSYKTWLIDKILVSGDNWRETYDEVTTMQKYLISKGVKQDDIYLDYAWFDTFDTLYRAKHIFWVENSYLYTQEFHLKRAVYIGKRLWIETQGISTDLQDYIYTGYYNRREVLARVKAFLNVEILRSKSKYLWNPVDMSKPQQEISKL